MSQHNLKKLIEKLNEPCVKALESSAALCLTQTHYDIEMEHFFMKILEQDNCDIHHILSYFSIHESNFKIQLQTILDSFKSGNSRHPKFSPTIIQMIQDAWFYASIDFQENQIRSGHLLISFIKAEKHSIHNLDQLNQISLEMLNEKFYTITYQSKENKTDHQRAALDEKRDNNKTALKRYTVNMTELAREGKIDPVVGRDDEIRQMIDILQRRRQNNPILTGEAGVGKTTVVEGFALRIAEGNIPPKLHDIAIHRLDIGLLQAGTGVRGEFEKRLTDLIKEVKASPISIVLFIDEAHTLIGAGSASGPSGNATDLLKPELSRGEISIIGATTWAEYEKYFSKDEALTRRFHVISVDEPDEQTALTMLKTIVPYYEKHHNVLISNDALLSAIRLSARYIPGRKLPDKAVSVLDTACARISMGFTSKSIQLDTISQELANIDRDIRIFKREIAFGRQSSEALDNLIKKREKQLTKYQKTEQQWIKEKELSQNILQIKQSIEKDLENDSNNDLTTKQEKLKTYENQLQKIQTDTPMVKTEVTEQTISDVISSWTGIPTGNLHINLIDSVLNLKENLSKSIIGQDSALDTIAKTLQIAYAGVEDPSKPKGVLLLIGPSGVGKTETALTLARLLYGGEDKLISINMSEYQEAHTVSGLKGSPPGYVGFGEGGVLTDAVSRKPFSVLLLDEMEKADTHVMDLFYQVFDKGILEDGEGRKIDFKNTLILLTSNIGSQKIRAFCSDDDTRPEPEILNTMLYEELKNKFKPEFLGRLKIVPYYPLTRSNMKDIIRLKLEQIVSRFKNNKNIDLQYSNDLVAYIYQKCTQLESGARNIDLILTNTLLPELSNKILFFMAQGKSLSSIQVSLTNDNFILDIA